MEPQEKLLNRYLIDFINIIWTVDTLNKVNLKGTRNNSVRDLKCIPIQKYYHANCNLKIYLFVLLFNSLENICNTFLIKESKNYK